MKDSLHLNLALALACLTMNFPLPALAGETDITGFAGADLRAFWHDAQFAQQSDDPDASFVIQPELYWQNESGDQRFAFVGFARADSIDSERSHADIREAYWSMQRDSWDVGIGISKVFWGVVESRHLVDTINQADLVEDIDQEDKLGQPMINVGLQRDFGRFELFVLPYFRERTFPGPKGRLRTPLPVETGAAMYESGDEEHHIDLALRYSHYFGDVDLGLHIFDGTSREPIFLPGPDSDSLLPYYEQNLQVGVELQYTRDSWLWKLEAMSRNAKSDTFSAATGGFEYTFYSVGDSAVDVGLLLEYSYDGRNQNAPVTVFDNDTFIGTRLAFNDAEDTSVLAGLAIDNDSREMFLNIEAERRIGDALVAELRVRSFLHVDPGDSLSAFVQDDYVQFRLSWYY